MTDKTDQWFVAERTLALALMHLSRREDLVIKDLKEQDIGLDLLVYIMKKKVPPTLRQFGIALRGTASPVSEEQLNRVLRPTMESFLRIGQFPYPVGLLHFTMQDDQGYFTWLAEPEVAEGEPRLLLHSEPHCHKFDRDMLNQIVGEVDRWYDAFFARIAVKAS